MKVAVFSDVHGNLIALEQFVHATKNVADCYLSLGDVVNYGPWSNECVDLVMSLPGIVAIRGNHEEMFLGEESIDDEIPLVRAFTYHAREKFSRSRLIENLPITYQLGSYQCIHTLERRSIYPDTEIEISQNYMIGHSHHQYQIERSGFQIVNPGSVGQNRKWIDCVQYLIFDTESSRIEMNSFTYDVDLFISELRSQKYPQECVSYYASKQRKS